MNPKALAIPFFCFALLVFQSCKDNTAATEDSTSKQEKNIIVANQHLIQCTGIGKFIFNYKIFGSKRSDHSHQP